MKPAWVIAALLACGKPATMPKPPGDLDVPDAGVAAVDAAPATVDAAVNYGARPVPPGPSVSLKRGVAQSLGELVLKHTAHDKQDSLTIDRLEVARGGKTKQLELRSMETGFEAELDVHGSLLVFRQLGTDLVVTLAADRTPTPKTEEECAALIDAGATAAGHATTSSRTYTDANGVLVMLTRGWRGYCGRYTRRVWFGPK